MTALICLLLLPFAKGYLQHNFQYAHTVFACLTGFGSCLSNVLALHT